MIGREGFRRFAGVVGVVLVVGAPAAWGQDGAEDARARQSALYARLLDAPDDPALMVEYAQVSVELGDYEAAISTLERALIYNPRDAGAMLELGAAYFRLGSYDTARFHLERARAAGLPAERDAQAARFLAEIDDRVSPSQFAGRVSAGFVASSNANLGPAQAEIRFLGLSFAIDDSFTEEGDTGFRVTASARHSYDLGRPRPDFWITDADLYSLRFFEEDAGDVDSFRVRTGPRLSVDEEAFGLKARPFLSGGYVRSIEQPLYGELGGGLELSDALTPELGAFGRAELVYRDFFSGRDDFDGPVGRLLAGVAHQPTPATTFRLSGFVDREWAEEDFNANVAPGVLGSFSADYDPGFVENRRLWTVEAYAEVLHRRFDEEDPLVDPDETRRDTEVRLGLAHLFRLAHGFGVQLDVDALRRSSNIENFDLDSVTGGASVVYEF